MSVLLTKLEKNVRRFREKFHGKVAIDKATILMRRYLNNHHMVTMEVILMKDRGTLFHSFYICLFTNTVMFVIFKGPTVS